MHLTSLKKENPGRKTSTASGLPNAGRKHVAVNIEYQDTIDKFGCRIFTKVLFDMPCLCRIVISSDTLSNE